MNSRRTIRPKPIQRSPEIYKAIAADAAARGMTPKQFAERFMEEGVELYLDFQSERNALLSYWWTRVALNGI
jgi:hypothetical protein